MQNLRYLWRDVQIGNSVDNNIVSTSTNRLTLEEAQKVYLHITQNRTLMGAALCFFIIICPINC